MYSSPVRSFLESDGSWAGLKEVLDAGDWANVNTFKRFYYKPEPITFSDSVGIVLLNLINICLKDLY